jgi:thioredoxin reductase
MGPVPAVVKSDPMTRETTVAGVYVAGDAGAMIQGAIMAASSGAQAAASLNKSLISEEAAAVASGHEGGGGPSSPG